MSSVGWTEWRHAVAIFVVCAFAALALDSLGFRVTIALSPRLPPARRRATGFDLLRRALGRLRRTPFFLFDTFLRVPLPLRALGL